MNDPAGSDPPDIKQVLISFSDCNVRLKISNEKIKLMCLHNPLNIMKIITHVDELIFFSQKFVSDSKIIKNKVVLKRQ